MRKPGIQAVTIPSTTPRYPHELAQRLLEVYLDEGGEPQDAPRPPDESVDPVAAVALRNAQETSRDGVDGNKETVDAIEALVEVEDGVEGGIEVGKRKQQAGAACVVPRDVCPALRQCQWL